jgi:hypothetical protein
LVRTCEHATTCIYQGGPYPGREAQYFAKARDAAGNVRQSEVHTITIYHFE